MPWTVLREVVLEEAVSVFHDDAISLNLRFEDQWRGVEWLLSRTPEKGVPRFSCEPRRDLLRSFPRNHFARTEALSVLYSYDDSQVIIHGAHFEADDN